MISTIDTSARLLKDYAALDDEIGDVNAEIEAGEPQKILVGHEGNKDLPTVNGQRI